MPGLTVAEGETHFALWCVTSAPLLLGFDVAAAAPEVLAIVGNEAAIEVNQQWAGGAGDRVLQRGDLEGWAKPMPDGAAAVLFNGGAAPLNATVPLSALGMASAAVCSDVFRNASLGAVTALSVALAPHACLFVRCRA